MESIIKINQLQIEFIEAIDSMMRKVDKSLYQHELYYY